jgi:hypothetical protein
MWPYYCSVRVLSCLGPLPRCNLVLRIQIAFPKKKPRLMHNESKPGHISIGLENDRRSQRMTGKHCVALRCVAWKIHANENSDRGPPHTKQSVSCPPFLHSCPCPRRQDVGPSALLAYVASSVVVLTNHRLTTN